MRYAVLALALMGCVKKGEYEIGQTVGHVPCMPKEIRVTSYYENTPAGNAGVWAVECRGVQYQCAQQVGDLATYMMVGNQGMAAAQKPVECQPLGPAVPQAASSSTPAPVPTAPPTGA